MEEWLRDRGISAKDWTGYLRRDLHRARHTPPPAFDDLAAQYPLEDIEAARLALVDSICAGDIDHWARTLAARVAANRSTGATPTENGVADPDAAAVPAGLVAALGIDAQAWHESSRRIHAVDVAFEHFRKAQITDQAVETYVAARQLEWIRFDCRIMSFPQPDMAAEAALMMREDGERFTGVYRAARTEPRESRFYFENLDDSLRDSFIGVQTGDLVGPTREGDEFVVYLVENKVLPSARDPEIRRLAEDGVLSHALKQQLDHHVEWHAVLH
jgi:hypothetical protein